MAHHGALCMGESYEEAMAVAATLEGDCSDHLLGLKIEATDPPTAKYNLLNSHRGPEGFAVFEKTDDRRQENEIDSKVANSEQNPQRILHQMIYNKRKDINAIIQASNPVIVASSERRGVLKPFLDDVAQLIGTSVRTSFWDPKYPEASSRQILSALKGRHAVLISGAGALCCGKTHKDAEAVQLVLNKGCRASNLSQTLDISQPIHPWECFLMRQNYLRVYAKKAGDAYKD
jgi:ribulose-5-phosphate 4-epimerase/fuculose-1-phosphate aldolase